MKDLLDVLNDWLKTADGRSIIVINPDGSSGRVECWLHTKLGGKLATDLIERCSKAEADIAILGRQLYEAELSLRRAGFIKSADGKLWVPPVNEAAAKLHRLKAAIQDLIQSGDPA